MSQTNKFIRLSAKTFLLSMGLTLVACGGGGSSGPTPVSYTGNTSPAVVDSAQAEEIAGAFFEASEKNVGGVIAATISSDQTLDDSSKNTLVEQLKQDALNSLSNLQNNNQVLGASGSAISAGNCVANGVTEVGDGTATSAYTSVTNTSVKIKTTYSNLCIYNIETGAYIVMNGSVDITISGTNLLNELAVINTISMTVPSLSVKHTSTTGEIFTITISESYYFAFTYNGAGELTGLDFSSYSNISSGGLVYRFETTVISDVVGGSSTVTLKFYHPTHGVVEYSLSGMTFNCADGSADAGTLTITAANATYTISPTGDCDGTYIVSQIP